MTSGEIEPDSFEAVARRWIEKKHRPVVSHRHTERTLVRFKKVVFPHIGAKPIGEITGPMLLDLLRRVEARGVGETAHRINYACGQVFQDAMLSGLCDRVNRHTSCRPI